MEEKIKDKINTDSEYWIGHGPRGVWYHSLNPSQPGEPPHKMRGDLLRSITHEVDRDKLIGRVGMSVEYGVYLEFGAQARNLEPRPYFRSTINENAETVSKILATGKK